MLWASRHGSTSLCGTDQYPGTTPAERQFFFHQAGCTHEAPAEETLGLERLVDLHLHVSFPQGRVGHRDCIGQTNINKLVFTFSLRCRCQPLYAFITAMCWDIELIRVELVWSFSPMFSLARRRKFSKGFYSILRRASMKRPCAHSRKPIRNLVKLYVILEGPPVMR